MGHILDEHALHFQLDLGLGVYMSILISDDDGHQNKEHDCIIGDN